MNKFPAELADFQRFWAESAGPIPLIYLRNLVLDLWIKL
jgi:hypothetical protein